MPVPARIIPALAGNTGTSMNLAGLRKDHPRSRGEYVFDGVASNEEEGSSPLSRGIRSRRGSNMLGSGIIPALAGNTPAMTLFSRPSQDHPRSRGEYRTMVEDVCRGNGSSPLSRGILQLRDYGRAGERIIPALAGNTER